MIELQGQIDTDAERQTAEVGDKVWVLALGVDVGERVAPHVGVEIQSAGEADRIGLEVTADPGAVPPTWYNCSMSRDAPTSYYVPTNRSL